MTMAIDESSSVFHMLYNDEYFMWTIKQSFLSSNMQFKSDRIKYTLSLSGYEGKTITGRLTLFSPNSVKL